MAPSRPTSPRASPRRSPRASPSPTLGNNGVAKKTSTKRGNWFTRCIRWLFGCASAEEIRRMEEILSTALELIRAQQDQIEGVSGMLKEVLESNYIVQANRDQTTHIGALEAERIKMRARAWYFAQRANQNHGGVRETTNVLPGTPVVEMSEVPNPQRLVAPAVLPGLPPAVKLNLAPTLQGPVQTGLPPAVEMNEVPNPQHPVTPAVQPDLPPAVEVNETPNPQRPVTPAVQTGLPPAVEVNETPNPERPVTPAVQTGLPPAMEVSQVPNPQHPVTPAVQAGLPPAMEVNKVPNSQHPVTPAVQTGLPPVVEVSETPNPERPVTPTVQTGLPPAMEVSQVPNPQRPVASSTPRPAPATQTTTQTTTQSQGGGAVPSSNVLSHGRVASLFAHSRSILPPTKSGSSSKINTPVRPVRSPPKRPRFGPSNMSLRKENKSEASKTLPSTKKPVSSDTNRPPGMLTPLNSSLAITPPDPKSTGTPGTGAAETVESTGTAADLTANATKPQNSAQGPMTPSSAPRPQAPKSRPRLLFPMISPSSKEMTATTPSSQAPRSVVRRPNIWGKPEPAKRPKETATQPLTFPQPPAATTTTTTTTPSAQAPKPVAPRTNIRDTPETIKRLWTDMMGDAEPVKRPRATAPQPFTFPQRPASTTTPAGWGGVEPWGAGLFPYHGAPRWS